MVNPIVIIWAINILILGGSSIWVYRDLNRKKMGNKVLWILAIVFFWFIAFPVYLYKTKGGKAVAIFFLLVIGIFIYVEFFSPIPSYVCKYFRIHPAVFGELKMPAPPKNGIQIVATIDTEQIPKDALKESQYMLVELFRNRLDKFEDINAALLMREHEIVLQLPNFLGEEKAAEIFSKPPSFELKLTEGDFDINELNAQNKIRNIRAVINAGSVEKISVEYDDETAYVLIELNEYGKQTLDKVTTENIGKHIAIVVDGRVITAPKIMERIPDGRLAITGKMTTEEARNLTLIIKASVFSIPFSIDIKKR